jgi:AraC-like DNA-binding protein/mannose-6-phosphate isomerase-like protein (cupin superfamily)
LARAKIGAMANTDDRAEALFEEAAFRCDHVTHAWLPLSWGSLLELARHDKIYVVTGGRGELTVGSETWELRPGRVCLIPAGSVQQGRCDPRRGLEILWTHFEAQTLAAMHLLRVVPFPRCVRGRTARRVRDLAGELLAEWEGGRSGRQLALKALLPAMLRTVLRAPRRDLVSPGRRERAGAAARGPEALRVGQISAAVERVIRDYRQPLKLADLASAAHLSPAHFSEVFREMIGMPPMKFLRRHRMRRAQSLLRLTDRSVADIAAEVGYVDPYHFSRAFRGETGVSPTAYRRGREA